MAVFAVHLSGDAVEDQAKRLREAYPRPQSYRVSERFYLVRSEDISSGVAEKLGLTDTENQSGAVFKLNRAYAGWDKRTMWEWMALGERSECAITKRERFPLRMSAQPLIGWDRGS